MASFTDTVRQRLAAAAAATARFYRSNSMLLLSAFTILSVLLIVWARLGFTFEINRFFAAGTPTDPSGRCEWKTNFNAPDGGWFCNPPGGFPDQCMLAGNETDAATPDRKPPVGPASRLAVKVFRLIDIAPDPAKGPIHIRTVLDATPKSGSSEGYPPKDPLWSCTAAPGVMELGRNGHDFYDCYNPIIHRYNYGPITCCANTGLAGDCFTWDLANPNPSASPAPTSSVIPTPGPGEPAAGTLQAVCTGGTSPQLTVKWSKSPPPGNTGELNPGNPAVLNRTLNSAAVQINPSATDRGSYWEWVDNATPLVTSGSSISYTGKYGANVKTNTVTIVASPANCGAVVSPLPCAPEGAAPESPSVGPDNQQYNGTCCAGLEKVPYPNPSGLVGTAPSRCVRPGCYYQAVQCVTTPCPAATLICPSQSPAPLSCAPVSQTVDEREEAEVEADGGTGTNTWEAFQDGDEIDVDVRGDTATVRFTEPGTHTVQVTSGGRSASCRVTVRDTTQSNFTHLECINGTCARVPGQGANQCSTDRAACTGTSESSAIIVTARNVSTAGAESDNVSVRTGQQVEMRIRVTNRSGSGTLNGIMVDAALPAGVTYVPGSTMVRNIRSTFNTIVAGGLDIGALGPGQDVLVTFRANVSAASFAVGTTQAQAAARIRAAGAQDTSDTVQFTVTRPERGGSGGAQTGPGEALLAAFLVAAVMTLLYTSYTHTASYKRQEIGSITRQRDPLDFRS